MKSDLILSESTMKLSLYPNYYNQKVVSSNFPVFESL